MRQLNIQERKLNIIEHLIMLNDDQVLKKIEDLINSSLNKPLPKILTIQELTERAQLSEKDIKSGDVYSQEDVEKLSQNW